MLSNLSRYHIRHCGNSDRKRLRYKNHNRHSTGETQTQQTQTRTSYGVSIVRILEKIDHVISTPHNNPKKHPVTCCHHFLRNMFANFLENIFSNAILFNMLCSLGTIARLCFLSCYIFRTQHGSGGQEVLRHLGYIATQYCHGKCGKYITLKTQ